MTAPEPANNQISYERMTVASAPPSRDNESHHSQKNGEVLEGLDFREIGDHLYDGIYVADGSGKTLYINKAYTRITGIRPQEVLGRHVDELVSSGLFLNAVTPEVIRQKKQVNAIGFVPRTNMKMLVTGTPIFDENGEVKKVVVIDREFSDLLAMKEELDTSRKKMKTVEKSTEKNKQELEHLRRQQRTSGLIGDSDASILLRQQIDQVADLDVTVLLTGETGVGKEVVATEIHQHSVRRDHPFIKVNCAAIPASLLEAELFGHEKGAFTGASANGRMGLFELAEKGTLLLDELGDMPIELQAKLLRVIQQKEVTRIGGRAPIKLDVRIITATNADLKAKVRDKLFREDLFYRINVFPIGIRPLRERRSDIVVLAEHFLETYNTKHGKNVGISEQGIELLLQYSWPGNARELQNIIERLVIVSDNMRLVEAEQIGIMLGIDEINLLAEKELGLKEIIENLERRIIEKALRTHGSTRKAALALKVDQSTIVKKRKGWK